MLIPAYVYGQDEEEMTYVMLSLVSRWSIAPDPYRLYAWVGEVKYVLVADDENLQEVLPQIFDFEWNEDGEAFTGGRSGDF